MSQNIRVGSTVAGAGERSSGWLTVGELDQLGFARGEIRLPVIVANGKHGGPVLALIAGQHPGEYVGMQAAIQLAASIDLDDLTGCVIAVPVLNSYGVTKKIPYVCPFDGLNMNRLWPGAAGGTVGQRTVYAVWNEIIVNADYFVDLHGGDFPEYQADYAIYFETGNQNTDNLSREMARHFGARYVRKSSISEGGRATGPAARMAMQLRGIPSIVTEVGDAGFLDSKRLEQNTMGLRNVITMLGMLPGDPKAPPVDQREMISRTSLLCSRSGFSHLLVQIGQPVKEGDSIAELRDYSGNLQEAISSPCDGDVVQLFYQGWMNEGEIVAKIASLASQNEEGQK